MISTAVSAILIAFTLVAISNASSVDQTINFEDKIGVLSDEESIQESLTSRSGCYCRDIYNPVCCKVHGKKVTKSNVCECKCVGKVLSKGKCTIRDKKNKRCRKLEKRCKRRYPYRPCKFCKEDDKDDDDDDDDKKCLCSREFDPVCCKVHGVLQTVSNPCICKKCLNGFIAFRRKCSRKH